MTHPIITEALAPFRPLTYTDHYYVDLGYRFERGHAHENEYRMAMAEGPEARRLIQRGVMEAMQKAY